MIKENIQGISRKKKQLSNENLPHFQWELRSFQNTAYRLFKDYPISGPRNRKVHNARLESLDCILANISNGPQLIIPNFSRIKSEELGFSRSVFLDVLDHLEKVALIGREGKSTARSIIEYSSRIRRYLPTKIVFQPTSPVIVNLKAEGVVLRKVNTVERRELKDRMKRVWDFYRQHEISTGVDQSTFNLFDEVEIEVLGKIPLIFPDPSKILPYIVYNDKDLTKGGRMYGAFWIGVKKVLRRAITIDGELTADIDGKGMHVQLLYQISKAEMPKGDPYLFEDERRSVAKKLMLLMLNTKRDMTPEAGRKTVAFTYRKKFGTTYDTEFLIDRILELESHHYKIVQHLYKPNWGNLQKTEAGIMLSIMEMGMNDDIVVLPVHDGCLCPRQHKEKVLTYFDALGIVSVENREHLQPLPKEKARALLRAAREYKRCA